MRKKSGPRKATAEPVVNDISRNAKSVTDRWPSGLSQFIQPQELILARPWLLRAGG